MLSDLSLNPQTILLFVAMGVSVLGALFALFSAVFAQGYSSNAKKALSRAYQSKGFSTLDRAGLTLIDNPRLLSAVHGLPQDALKELGPEEASNVAYLFLLLNGFRQTYDERYNGDFKKMLRALKKRPSTLNKLMAQGANQRRLRYIEAMSPDEVKDGYIECLLQLAEHENSKR